MDDPRIERALEEWLEQQRSSRRRFIGRSGSAALLLGGLSSVLAACGGVKGTAQQSSKQSSKQAASVNHPKVPIGNWTFSNWPLYMDKHILKSFDKKFGGHVKYLEDINDNFEFYGKVRQQLQNGQPIGRDIVVLTDYMAGRWIRDGYATAIDKKNVPNAKNVVDNLKSINYDPKRQYTLPYQSGAIGLGYNIKQTGRELKSLNDLFDPKFKGKVTMLSEPYDSACTVLLGMGIDASKASIDQIQQAIDKIDKYNKQGQFRRFTGNDYSTDLSKGNTAVALAYAGDLIQLQSDNPDLRFSYAEEGNMIFNDNLMMPAHVQHPYAAETMFNYLYDPEVAAKLAAYVNYISPVKGAKEVLEKTDPKAANNPLIFPSTEISSKFHAYPALSPADERTMQEAMAKVTGA
jgi:spermidine/putrescine transport system substrate-binding protein